MRYINIVNSERGQALILYAAILAALVLFAGLAIDSGLLYVTKAKLSTAVDAACLTGMKNLLQGQSTATTLATDAFNANFGAHPPTPSITFPTDSAGDLQVKVTATATVNTLFMKIVPAFATVNVSDTAVATRGMLAMSLVLDNSQSMSSDGGASALPPAVTAFVDDFNNTADEVAMIHFSTLATLDYAIATHFQAPITTAVKALNFDSNQPEDSTTSPLGLAMAKVQEDSVIPKTGQNVIKVVVFFTDGLANAIQQSLLCGGKATTVEFGGIDSSGNSLYFFDSTGSYLGTYSGTGGSNPYCNGVTTFTSSIPPGNRKNINQPNVTADSIYDAEQSASAMRAEGIYIYSIGLGGGIDTTTKTFLQTVANDPGGPNFDSSQPAGLFFNVPNCPSTTCTASLNAAFQTIASKVLLRLTQ